ncbi:ATP-binding protein [Streptosporangium sp. NPDC051022]|uniref:ATP-binding protein n=1 Tax=Streptosporangium sp. NPDC051022 TaxID=3155752 RepID=UPI003424F809
MRTDERQRRFIQLGRARFSGRPTSVGRVRGWARRLLAGEVADDVLDDTVVLLSELVTNSVLHSDSGREPDGFFTVFVAAGDGVAHCAVIDEGSATNVPVVREMSDDGNVRGGGRGLWLVSAMADAWGFHHDDESGNAVWFQIGGCSRPAFADGSREEPALPGSEAIPESPMMAGASPALAGRDAEP